MSVESKIKELLGRVEAKATLDEADKMGADTVKKDSTLKPANSGDASNPMQGSSEKASFETREGDADENQGAKVSASTPRSTAPTGKGPGAASNFTTVADPTPSATGKNPTGNKPMEEEVEEDGEYIESEDTTEIEAIDLSPIFGADLSEDFKQKATAIFEAAVIARVNHEMEKVALSLEEKYEEDFADLREGMVEKIDSYLNYVVEQWMQENELALESGLRTEIAEDFISGLKNLFKEHYVEVPEEKYDVIGELQTKAEELEQKLDEAISTNVELSSEIVELKRKSIVEELSKDLAATEAAKLQKLVEGISFDDEDIYSEKVAVIKENYFPKNKPAKAETTTSQTLVEDASDATTVNTVETSSTVAAYARALSRSKRA